MPRWSFMCFPSDTMCCFQEEELRAEELRAAGLSHLACIPACLERPGTGEEVAQD